MQINYLKITQCDFLNFCFRFRHSQLKSTYDEEITDFYMLCKWENKNFYVNKNLKYIIIWWIPSKHSAAAPWESVWMLFPEDMTHSTAGNDLQAASALPDTK